MKEFWSKLKKNLKWISANILSVVVAILIIIAIPAIIVGFYFLISKKRTIRFYPKFEIIEINNEMDVDSNVAKEGIRAAQEILQRIKNME
jgi:cytoskeletal protein RodZ